MKLVRLSLRSLAWYPLFSGFNIGSIGLAVGCGLFFDRFGFYWLFQAVTWGFIGVAVMGIVINFTGSMSERQMFLAILRVLGASRRQVFLLVVLEGLWLVGIGSIVGVLGYVGSIALVTEPSLFFRLWMMPDLWRIPALTVGFGGLVSLFPAIQAYRMSVTDIVSR